MKKRDVRERIYVGRKEADEVEKGILNRWHFERYMWARQYAYGRVVDVACGCGYGTYLVSKNPDVEKITGLDISLDAITYADAEYGNDKTGFECLDATGSYRADADVVICFETIEHIEDTGALSDFIVGLDPRLVMVSYPAKKTTHYNKHHVYDFTAEEVIGVFASRGYVLAKSRGLFAELDVLAFVKREHRAEIFRTNWRLTS